LWHLAACIFLHSLTTPPWRARAARVEYKLPREALTGRGIDSVDDYFAKRADRVRYLAREWFWMTAGTADRENKHQSPAEVLPLWAEVQAGLQAWAGTPAGLSLAPLDRAGVDVSQLFKQAYGIIRTAAEYQGKKDMGLLGFMTYACHGLRTAAANRR